METLLQDIRYSFRVLMKNPGFATVAVLTLALGMGANTAIFSVVNAVLLRPLPYVHPEELISLQGGQSWPDLHDIEEQNRSFEKVGAFVNWQFDLIGRGEPEQIKADLISLNLFETLRAMPEMGRTFSEKDDQPGSERVVVLSKGFWQSKLGGDPNIVGKPIMLSGNNYTVIGIMPESFRLPRGEGQLWAPFRIGYPEAANERGVHFQYAIARMKAGISRAQAQADLDAIGARLAQLYPDENRDRKYVAVPLQERVVSNVRPILALLFGAVGLVLLIASGNFANLLLAKASAQRQETQIRIALGAAPGRLIRQHLTESLLISGVSSVVGLALAQWGLQLLLLLKPGDLPQIARVEIDARVLLFALVLSLLTGCVFGLLPVLQVVLPSFSSAVKTGKVSGQSRTTTKLRQALIVGELAISLMLLCGAGLLIRSFWRLQSVDPGFNADRVITTRIWLPAEKYASIESQNRFFGELSYAIKQIPGVESSSLVSEPPLSGNNITHDFVIAGRPAIPVGSEPGAQTNLIMPDYFHTLQIPVLKGRAFTDEDRAGAPLVAVINQSMATQHFKNEDPIGARVRFARSSGPPKWLTIVGVVGDVKEFGLDQEQEPAIYTAMLQKQEQWRRWSGIVVRSSVSTPMNLADPIKKAIWKLEPQVPVKHLEPLAAVLNESLAPRRFNTLLLGLFALTALVLAVVGVYGVISYMVTMRTQEIGVRMALGARTLDVFWLVLKQGLGMAGIGIAIGVAGSIAISRLLKSMLFGVDATDPLTFGLTAILLAAVALLASYIPANRAAKIDPIVALRYE